MSKYSCGPFRAGLNNSLKAAFAAFFLFIGTGTPVPLAAQEVAQPSRVQMSPAQARGLARQALAGGNAEMADAISKALIERNPSDAEAHLIQALVARGRGDLRASRDASARAYQLA
ncbi:MAG: hypothetical protein GKR98_01755 [Boseongicola sp.]|nr:MAG: hypothetical protein GKR98_01755 [Boseongicola sp.]